MTAPARRPRRRLGGGVGSETLARLTAAREQLDAALVARRRREDELLVGRRTLIPASELADYLRRHTVRQADGGSTGSDAA